MKEIFSITPEELATPELYSFIITIGIVFILSRYLDKNPDHICTLSKKLLAKFTNKETRTDDQPSTPTLLMGLLMRTIVFVLVFLSVHHLLLNTKTTIIAKFKDGDKSRVNIAVSGKKFTAYSEEEIKISNINKQDISCIDITVEDSIECVQAKKDRNHITILLDKKIARPKINNRSKEITFAASSKEKVALSFTDKANNKLIPNKISNISLVVKQDTKEVKLTEFENNSLGEYRGEIDLQKLSAGTCSLFLKFNYNDTAKEFFYDYVIIQAPLPVGKHGGLSTNNSGIKINKTSRAALVKTSATDLQSNPGGYITTSPRVSFNTRDKQKLSIEMTPMDSNICLQVFFGNYRFDVGGSDGRSITQFLHYPEGKLNTDVKPESQGTRFEIKKNHFVKVEIEYDPKAKIGNRPKLVFNVMQDKMAMKNLPPEISGNLEFLLLPYAFSNSSSIDIYLGALHKDMKAVTNQKDKSDISSLRMHNMQYYNLASKSDIDTDK